MQHFCADSALLSVHWQGTHWQNFGSPTCIALLEVSSAAALDQQRITSEHHASSVRLDSRQVE
jgi:hypothetical protein